MNLSKSRYVAFRQCPKLLWMNINKPQEAAEADESRMAAGIAVGNLAKGYFGAYKEATATKADGNLDIAKMIADTKKYLVDSSVETICEAAFTENGCYCAVDLLHREKGGWAIYEVKSSSHKAEYDKKGFLKQEKIDESYIRDIAYQKYVLELAGVQVTGTYLVRLEKSYVLNGDLDPKQLFHITDMSQWIKDESSRVAAYCADAKKILSQLGKPDTKLHMGCNSPCAFFEYCKRFHHIPSSNSVFDIYGGIGRGGFTFEKKLAYYYQNKVSFADLRNEHIGKIQDMQIACTLSNKAKIDKKGIKTFFKTVKYPLYHLDFETVQYAIPEYQGTHPYQQVPTQYSLHIQPSQTGNCDHREFLADARSENPMRDVAEQLCKDIPADKCVLVYNKAFEQGRLEEMANAFPDLHDHLMAIHDNIIDLLDPFRAGGYYLPAMGGSFSIKKVLPALFPNDPRLDYHKLPGCVHNGGEAMDIFPKMKNMSREEEQQTRKDLLQYCELDTWSMVVILKELYRVSK